MTRYTLTDLERMEGLPNSRQTFYGWIKAFEAEHGEGSFTCRGVKQPDGRVLYDESDLNELLSWKGYPVIAQKVVKPDVQVTDSNHTNVVDLALLDVGMLDISRFKGRSSNTVTNAQVDILAESAEELAKTVELSLSEKTDSKLQEYLHNIKGLSRIKKAQDKISKSALEFKIKDIVLGQLNDLVIEQLAEEKQELIEQIGGQESEQDSPKS